VQTVTKILSIFGYLDMKKTYLLICFIFTCALHSKNKYEIKAPDYLHKLYEKMLKEASQVPINITLYRAEKILNQFVQKNVYTENEYSALKEIHGGTMLFLMDKHTVQHQHDSVQYYHGMIEENIVDPKVLGTAELYLSKNNLREKKYLQAINCLYRALDHFKKINDTDKEITTYLKLAELYKKIKSVDLSREMDAILMQTYLNKNIPKSLKSRILINHASYLASLGKNREAIDLLKSLEFNNFSETSYVFRYYNEELLKRYLKLHIVDSAYIYLKKMYEIPNTSFPEDKAKENIYYAMILLKEKKPKKALQYINRARKSEALKYVEQFELIKFHKTAYLANKMLGKYEEALNSSVKYQFVRDSVKNFNLNVNVSLLNFKLNHGEKIKELKSENEMKDLVLEEKKKFYIFSTFLVSVSLSIFIFIIILHKRKKKRLKLQYENEKMKEIVAIKNNFIENLSHEIRTPITITTGYLRLIANNAMDYSKIIKYADITVRNNEQIIQMLNNFLTLLKLDKNPTTHKVTSEKMEAFLKESVYDFQGVAEIKGVSVYYKSNIKSNQLLDYKYDDLRKIVNNLISNALKYTNPRNGIYVHTFIDENGLNLIVKDEGIGIDKEEQKLIFDRFYQSKSHSLTGGFGIGLSLVHELVTKLNGSITLNSKKDIGSVFTVQVPLALENHLLYVDENVSGYKSICNSNTVDSTVENKLPKILIVDDNIEMIGYLKELLAGILNCTFAFDGMQALSFAKKTYYDIILSDVRMPGMDGHELKVALNTLPN
jgi:signal transduction histidine kinase